MSQYDRTVIELIESAARTNRTAPLFLGGGGGAGGGVGVPPGGVVGQLPQYRVAYDTTEAATLATLPSGVAGISGWSLVDNLNHIRYRLGALESGGVSGSGIIVTDDNNTVEYSDTTNLHFVGSGVIVTDLGGGEVQVEINATGSGGGSSKFALVSSNYSDVTIVNLASANIVLDTELYNDDGLVSLSANKIHVLEDGWYDVEVIISISVNGGSPLTQDGEFSILLSNNNFFDNTYDRHPTINGSTISYSDEYARGTVYFSASGGNELYIRIDNRTGHTMTAYAHDVLVRPCAGGGGSGLADAPSDGSTYGRKDAAWVAISGGGGITDAPSDGNIYGRKNGAWTVSDRLSVTTKTSSYAAALTDNVILCNAASGIIITLPYASGTGKVLNVKSINIGTVVVSGYSTDTIDGYNTKIIDTIYDNLSVVDGGSGVWYIL